MCFANAVSRECVATILQYKWSAHDCVWQGNWSFRQHDTWITSWIKRTVCDFLHSIRESVDKNATRKYTVFCKKSSVIRNQVTLLVKLDMLTDSSTWITIHNHVYTRLSGLTTPVNWFDRRVSIRNRPWRALRFVTACYRQRRRTCHHFRDSYRNEAVIYFERIFRFTE